MHMELGGGQQRGVFWPWWQRVKAREGSQRLGPEPSSWQEEEGEEGMNLSFLSLPHR